MYDEFKIQQNGFIIFMFKYYFNFILLLYFVFIRNSILNIIEVLIWILKGGLMEQIGERILKIFFLIT